MKVYQVDDYSWYAAETARDAQWLYVADGGAEVEEYLKEFGPPREVEGEALDRLRITVEDELKGGPALGSYTFREMLALTTKPGLFATTEY